MTHFNVSVVCTKELPAEMIMQCQKSKGTKLYGKTQFQVLVHGYNGLFAFS